jgi:hypothetical protein
VFKTIIVKTFHERWMWCALQRVTESDVKVLSPAAGFVCKENEPKQRRISTRLLSYRPIARQLGDFSSEIAAVADSGSDNSRTFLLTFLLHKSHWRDGVGAFGRFLN